MKQPENILIAIDGFSSCGKSTFAKSIARYMAYAYIDTGAMYRAVTLHFLNNGVINEGEVNHNLLAKELDHIDIQFSYNPEKEISETYLNGVCVEKDIRDKAVANNVSLVASIKEVRKKLVELQRDAGKNKGIVLDGRDIGTVVFPDADIKIFMTADVHIRAQRRHKELIEKGMEQSLEEIEKNIEERDHLDQHRKESPLKKAEDAILLDNSFMTPDEQMEWFKQILQKTNGGQP